MNKKIFLTSMVALMVACPAYAELVNDPGSNPPTQSGYIASTSSSEPCDTDPLMYQGQAVGYGTYTLTAQWEKDECPITLNSHTGANEYGSTASVPTTLYARYGDNVYLSEADRTASTNAMSTTENRLTHIPTGKTYTLTLNTNVATAGTGGMNAAHTDSQVTAASGTKAASTTATMSFAGFYSDAQSSKTTTNGTQYIGDGNSGMITQNGITAGTSISKVDGTCPLTVWHAQYTCQDAATYTPQLTGYTFAGWYDAENDGNAVTDFCLDSNKTVYAHWAAKKYNIIYQPGNCAGSGKTILNALTYDMAPNHAVLSPSDAQVSIPTGYVFDYWSANIYGDDNHWDPTDVYGSSAWQTDGNLVFTANCVPDTYTVTYVAGTNCSGSNSDTATYADSYTVQTYSAAGMTANTGYHLPTGSGWSSDWTNGTSTTPGTNTAGSINAGNITYYIPNDVTLTMPNCVANEYKVTYICDNGTVNGILTRPNGETNLDAATFGDPYTFWSIDVCSAAGQTNSAWSCVGDTSGDTINQTTNAASWTTAENVTCTMQYDADMVGLVYLKEPGDTTPYSTDTCNYGNSQFTLPAQPTKTGYTFTGWKVTNHQ